MVLHQGIMFTQAKDNILGDLIEPISKGIQQGDNLISLLFSFCINHIVEMYKPPSLTAPSLVYFI